MNSKQRRRLRKQKLPELINLLATKRITGELHSWIDTGALIAGAARNPQRIYKVMPLIERGDYYDRHDFERAECWCRTQSAAHLQSHALD